MRNALYKSAATTTTTSYFFRMYVFHFLLTSIIATTALSSAYLMVLIYTSISTITISNPEFSYFLSGFVTKILTRRLEITEESYLMKDEFSFRKGRSTRDAIVALHVLYERNLE